MKKIKTIFKYLFIFVYLSKLQLFLKLKGFNFYIKSLNNNFLNIKISREFLIHALNSKFISNMNASCLVKSIAFMKLVNNSSSYSLCIGVSKINGNFESHAWIEINGNVILNSLDNMNNFTKIFVYG